MIDQTSGQSPSEWKSMDTGDRLATEGKRESFPVMGSIERIILNRSGEVDPECGSRIEESQGKDVKWAGCRPESASIQYLSGKQDIVDKHFNIYLIDEKYQKILLLRNLKELFRCQNNN